jgi:RNA recognition motif-containing protein
MNLFVANFDEDVTEEDLEDLFTRYGEVANVTIWINLKTGKSDGFGFVEVKDDWDAERAIERLDGKWWRGMRLKVCQKRARER